MLRKLPIILLVLVFFLGGCASTYEVTLSIDSEEAGTVSGSGTYKSGETVTVEAQPKPGYQFLHWMENGEAVSEDKIYRFDIAANRDLAAVFAVTEYIISAVANDQGSGSVSGGGTFNHGEEVTVTAVPNARCVFKGWMERGAVVSTAAAYKFSAERSRELIAEFELEGGLAQLKVSSLDSEKGSVTGAGIYETGKSITVEALPKDGFWFDSWTENGEVVSFNQKYKITLDGNRSLEANFVNTKPGLTKTLWEVVVPFKDTLVIDGKMLTLSRTAISCLDLKTGKTLWSRDYSEKGFHAYWEDSGWGECYRVVTDKEFTYTIIDDDCVYIEQVNLTTGEVNWHTQLDMPIQGKWLELGQEDGGQALSLTENDGLLRVDRVGLESWHFNLANGKEVDYLVDKKVFASEESYYTFSSAAPATVSRYSSAGELVWQSTHPGYTGIYEVTGNIVLCTIYDGDKYTTVALDTQTGMELWTQGGFPEELYAGKAILATASKLTIIEVGTGRTVNILEGNFASLRQGENPEFFVLDNIVYKKSDLLEAVDSLTGKVLWNKEIKGVNVSGRVVDDMTRNPSFRDSQVLWIVAGQEPEGILTAVNRNTGSIISSVPFPIYRFEWCTQDHIFADKNGKPLIATFDMAGETQVQMLDGLTGQMLWSYEYKERAAMLHGDGDYVALYHENDVAFLKTRTGELAFSFRVIGNPLCLVGNNLVVSKGDKLSLVQPLE